MDYCSRNPDHKKQNQTYPKNGWHILTPISFSFLKRVLKGFMGYLLKKLYKDQLVQCFFVFSCLKLFDSKQLVGNQLPPVGARFCPNGQGCFSLGCLVTKPCAPDFDLSGAAMLYRKPGTQNPTDAFFKVGFWVESTPATVQFKPLGYHIGSWGVSREGRSREHSGRRGATSFILYKKDVTSILKLVKAYISNLTYLMYALSVLF